MPLALSSLTRPEPQAIQTVEPRGIEGAFAERRRQRPGLREQVPEDPDRVGNVQAPIVIGIRGIAASRHGDPAEDVAHAEHGIGDIDAAITVRITAVVAYCREALPESLSQAEVR